MSRIHLNRLRYETGGNIVPAILMPFFRGSDAEQDRILQWFDKELTRHGPPHEGDRSRTAKG
jgi:hypothetical protein